MADSPYVTPIEDTPIEEDEDLIKLSGTSNGSGSTTPDADESKVLVRDCTPEEHDRLNDHRDKLSWMRFIERYHIRLFDDLDMKADSAEEDLLYQAAKAVHAGDRFEDQRNATNKDFLVQLYDKAHPYQTMEALAIDDARKVLFQVTHGPSGRNAKDVFRSYLKSTLPKWKPSIQRLDEWKPEAETLKRLQTEYKVQRNHRLHLQSRNTGLKKVEEALKEEERCEEVIKLYSANYDRLREQILQERGLLAEKQRLLENERDVKQRERIRKYFTYQLSKQGRAGKLAADLQ